MKNCAKAFLVIILLAAGQVQALRLPFKFEETLQGERLTDIEKGLYTVSMRLLLLPQKYPDIKAYGKILAGRKAKDADDLTVYNEGYWKAFFLMAPTDPNIYYSRLLLLFRKGFYKKAEYILTLAQYHSDIKKKEETKIVFMSLADSIKNITAESRRYIDAGITAEADGQTATARDLFQSALEVYPSNPEAFYHLALTYKEQDSTLQDMGKKFREGGEVFLDKALTYDPFYWEANKKRPGNINRAFIIHELVKPAWEAISAFRFEDNEFMMFGDACMKLEEYEMAIYAYWNHAILHPYSLLDPAAIDKIIECLKMLNLPGVADFLRDQIDTFNKVVKEQGIDTGTEPVKAETDSGK